MAKTVHKRQPMWWRLWHDRTTGSCGWRCVFYGNYSAIGALDESGIWMTPHVFDEGAVVGVYDECMFGRDGGLLVEERVLFRRQVLRVPAWGRRNCGQPLIEDAVRIDSRHKDIYTETRDNLRPLKVHATDVFLG